MVSNSSIPDNHALSEGALSSSGHDPDTAIPTTTDGARRQQYEAGSGEFADAISFAEDIKTRFVDKPEVYRTFRYVLHEYRLGRIEMLESIRQLLGLFWEDDDILQRFISWLPEGYGVEYTTDAIHTVTSINITTPDGIKTYSVDQIRGLQPL